MKHRVFDDEFKKMAVELSKVKESVKNIDFLYFLYEINSLINWYVTDESF